MQVSLEETHGRTIVGSGKESAEKKALGVIEEDGEIDSSYSRPGLRGTMCACWQEETVSLKRSQPVRLIGRRQCWHLPSATDLRFRNNSVASTLSGSHAVADT